MTAMPPPVPDKDLDGFPDYPGFGSMEDAIARMKLLDRIPTQLGSVKIEANVGDYVLATDGRILGVRPDHSSKGGNFTQNPIPRPVSVSRGVSKMHEKSFQSELSTHLVNFLV